ncbi:helix-turn-helix transcriptional regulator [Paenibacillus algorifonticola]|uniref:helix-turn-helix domain-containing protein n=1 Tax=Paenibacillus algorifonticola TaxID=684063 RepID=UPI003D286DEA
MKKQLTLKQLRENMGLTMEEVAVKTDIPVRCLKYWENVHSGRAEAFSIFKLLHFYGVSHDHVYTGPALQEVSCAATA